MKRLCLALIGVAAFAGAAAAADLARPEPVPYYPKAPVFVPPYSWTGFYVGINGGGGFGTSNWDSTGSRNISGGLVGGTVGYNYQFGHAVVGVEGDMNWADINGSTTNACPAGCKTSDSWLATVRGRLGYAADRFMPYVTGGAAFGDIRASTPGLPDGHCHQYRLDDRRRLGSSTRRQLDRQGRISLCRSRQIQLRIELRRRPDGRQRLVPHQPAARRRELSVLIRADNVADKAPRGFYLPSAGEFTR